MVRQPYSKAVPSTGGRLHPLAPEGFCPPELGGTEGGVKTIEERLGEKGGAFLKGKEGRVGFRKILLLSKEERGDSKAHTFQSPHNILTV